MRIEAKTFRVEYKMFDVGERIRPASSRCPLEAGEYVVTSCVAPSSPGDDSTVFVEGEPYGVGTEYLESADRENPRHAPDPTAAVLAFADMHAAATEGWERIAARVAEADLDCDGIINRLLAFVEAHGLGGELATYLAAQHARELRDEAEHG
jgi:pimeloyl-ACP methyl ester carboxylesterase